MAKINLDGYEWEDLTDEVETVNESSKGGWQAMLSDINNVPPPVNSDEIVEKLKQSGQWTESEKPSEEKAPAIEPPVTEPPAAPPASITKKQQVAASMYMKSWDMIFAGGAAMLTKNSEVYEIARAREKDLNDLSLMLAECFGAYNIDPEPWIPFVGFLTATYSGKSYEVFSFVQDAKGKDEKSTEQKLKELEDELKIARLRADIREAERSTATSKKSARAPEIKPEAPKRRGNPHDGTGKKTGPKPKRK